MTTAPSGPPCGNNPNYRFTDGDRAVVDDFRAYLAARADRRQRYATAIATADDLGSPEVCYPEADAAIAVADAEQRAHRAAVLREAAEIIEQVQHQRDGVVNDALGGLDRITEAEHRAVNRAAAALRRVASEERHVVADDSADPEHVDDCPGCQPTLASGLRAAAGEIAGIDFHPNAVSRSLDIARGLAHRLRRMADEAQQAGPWPSVTTYVVEVHDAGLWVGVSFGRKTLDEARTARETCRTRRLPNGRFRIVRWDETSTLVEVDEEQQP